MHGQAQYGPCSQSDCIDHNAGSTCTRQFHEPSEGELGLFVQALGNTVHAMVEAPAFATLLGMHQGSASRGMQVGPCFVVILVRDKPGEDSGPSSCS